MNTKFGLVVTTVILLQELSKMHSDKIVFFYLILGKKITTFKLPKLGTL